MTIFTRIIPVLFLLAVSGVSAWAQGPGKLPIELRKGQRLTLEQMKTLTSQAGARDKTSDAELKALQEQNPVRYGREFRKVGEDVAETGPPRGDLYENSLILTDGTNHTILPKGSLLHVPAPYAARVVAKPVGKLVFWPEFLKTNRRWVRGHEVTMAVSRGETPIAEPMKSRFELQKMVVVSVLRAFPISVLPPQEPEAGPVTSTSAPTGRFSTASRNPVRQP